VNQTQTREAKVMLNNRKRTWRWMAIALAIGLMCSADALAKKPPPPPDDDVASYDLVVLAPPGLQITGSNAYDLDEAGDVVGYYYDSDGEPNGFHYDRVQDSWRLFGPGVVVFGLNNLGEMVGGDWNTGEGLYWSAPGATPVPLPPLDGHIISDSFKINDAGIIVGRSHGTAGYVAAAWTVNEDGEVSAPVELPFPGGDTRGSAKDLSETDADGIARVVGYSGAVDPYETAVGWEVIAGSNGPLLLSGPIDLGTLNGGPAAAALAVNFTGDVAGMSAEDNGPFWPILKPAGHPMQPLPGTQKATWGYAVGINDNGNMVGITGYLFKGKSVETAVLWPDAHSVIDLNKKVALGRGEELESAGVINNAGDILASGFFPGVSESDYDYVACLLIAK
jgi:uncharacterized membrane protein